MPIASRRASKKLDPGADRMLDPGSRPRINPGAPSKGFSNHVAAVLKDFTRVEDPFRIEDLLDPLHQLKRFPGDSTF